MSTTQEARPLKPLKNVRPQHALALEMLLNGATHDEAARAAGMSRWAVTRLLKRLDIGHALRAEVSARLLAQLPAVVGHSLTVVENSLVTGLKQNPVVVRNAFQVLRLAVQLAGNPPHEPAEHLHLHRHPPDPGADLFPGLDSEADHDRAGTGTGATCSPKEEIP